MSNAANNIEAKSRSMKDLLFEKHYKVGYFQREYKWKRSNIEDLIIDLERSFNSNWLKSHTQKDVANYHKYYMGPVVFFMDDSEYSIVDGQQRLTSFILIMIFLNHKTNQILKIKDKFKGYIYSEHYGTEAYNMNIPERDEILNFLFKGQSFDESILSNESCKTLCERYSDIDELFPSSLLEPDVLPLFTNWIIEKLVFIEIFTQTSESAYTIFETMNDRGLNLTQTELLKSFLLSRVKDDEKIKFLDNIWKQKISQLNSIDDDQDFFKAWLRAKYAVSIRGKDRDSENKDFEKIGTRFSSWTQENTKFNESGESKLLLDNKDPDSFYFFVKSDFNFFSDLYIKLKDFELGDNHPAHRLQLISYKGVSQSLSYPLLLSPIDKKDDEDKINLKIDVVTNYIDAYGVYRMLLFEPITHSSIRNAIYLRIKDIRNLDLDELYEKLDLEIKEYKKLFLAQPYVSYNTHSKYILARIYQSYNPTINFENIYFQRRRDSFLLYQFLKVEDFDSESYGLPKGLKEKLVQSLCSYTLVPRQLISELDALRVKDRITRLIEEGLILDYTNVRTSELDNLKSFFINFERELKEKIINIWKLPKVDFLEED